VSTKQDVWPEHPLFPSENDEPAKRVDFIQVIRHEEGRSKQIPRMFRSDELKSLEDIYNLWGGGVYELWGRAASVHNPESHGKMTANRRYEIAGLSKPLTVDGANAIPASAPAPLAHNPAPQGPDTSVMGMFMQMQMTMMQNAQESARQTAIAQQAANERSRQESLQSQQMMMQMQTTMMTGMMSVVSAVVTKGGGGGVDDISKMAELFKTLGVLGPGKTDGADEGGGESIGEIVSNVADIVAGAVELRNGASPAAGSAAGVLGVPPVRKPDTVG
jgi:hypothetical protein